MRLPGLAVRRVEPGRHGRSASSPSGSAGSRRCSPVAQADALAVMGAFVLVFVIRMAGATMEQKEEAEAPSG